MALLFFTRANISQSLLLKRFYFSVFYNAFFYIQLAFVFDVQEDICIVFYRLLSLYEPSMTGTQSLKQAKQFQKAIKSESIKVPCILIITITYKYYYLVLMNVISECQNYKRKKLQQKKFKEKYSFFNILNHFQQRSHFFK